MDGQINGGKTNLFRVVFRRDAVARTAGAITEANGNYTIADTSTTAQVGDIYRPETATTAVMVDKEYKVIARTANSFTIASKDLPTLGDTFFILGEGSLRTDDTGQLVVSSTSGPAQFVLNGTDTEVSQDTGTPGNSVPFPTILLDASGNRVDPDTFSTLAEQQTQTTALGTLDTSVNALLKPASTLNAVTTVGTITNPVASTQSGTWNIDTVSTVTGVTTVSAVTTVGTITNPVAATQSGTWNVVPAANSSVNLNQVAGNGIQTNGGNRSSGTITVSIAEDQPAVDQNITQVNGQTVGAGQGQATAGTMRVTIATEDTATVTSVNDAATSGQLLASTSTRQGATFFNNSTESLYLKFGATASATDFTVKIAPGGYYELPGPVVYTGRIDGIWSANGSGAVLITEY